MMQSEENRMKEKRPFSGVEKLLLLAMAIANLVPEESLGGISAYARGKTDTRSAPAR